MVTLPRSPTVAEILEEFEQHIHNNPESKYSALPSVRLPGLFSSENDILHPSLRDPQVVLPTIVSGLKVYFDKALGSNLLYRFERPQYAEIRKRYVTGPTVQVNQEREMSAIYGAEHLLRMIGVSFSSLGEFGSNSTLLLVSLPSMVAGSTMDPESVGLVRDYVTELLM